MYDLYLIDAAVAQDNFLNGLESVAGDSPYKLMISGRWRPPLVFQYNQREAIWFIDVGQPFQIFSDWRVFSSEDGHAICTIAFSPPGKDSAKLLPQLVTKLTRQLEEVLGPGNDEGTLQPTARIRLNAKHVLANAALRPWALTDDDAYNSRSEVDAGLDDWARVNKSRRRLYSEISEAYPTAEYSLAEYYTSTYELPSQKAQQAAIWVLDLIFRSFFVFSKNQDYFRYDKENTNPWPLNH